MFAATVSLNSTISWLTSAMLARRLPSFERRDVDAVEQDLSGIGA